MSKKTLKKSRFFALHPETNPGKIEQLEALHKEYVSYVRICVQTMLEAQRYTLLQSEWQAFFPKATGLTSQIVKNARSHAIQIVSGWATNQYTTRLRKVIKDLRRAGDITDDDAKALYTIGKFSLQKPWKYVTQEHIDTYYTLLDKHRGRHPEVRSKIPIRLSEMTSRLEDPDEALFPDYWLRISTLKFRQSVWLPLIGNPYVNQADQVSKGIQARKTKQGRWRFEALDKREWKVPDASPSDSKLGVDVGLNVLAATSDGDLYGSDFKPKFDKIYRTVGSVRSNRRRQGFRENSPRLDRLESRQTGQIKTATNTIANRLVGRHPHTVFVIEDLDLRGCRGQKRFAYRALQTNLERKAPIEVVNPAYTSQECPSCGYAHRSNRAGIKFSCRSCGRQAHADWVGAGGTLRRSGDKGITCDDHPKSVKRVLRERYLRRRRDSSLGSGGPRPPPSAPLPSGPRLTTGGSTVKVSTGTASNTVSGGDQDN